MTIALAAPLVMAGLASCGDPPDCQTINTKLNGSERPFLLVYDATRDAAVADLPGTLQKDVLAAAKRSDAFSAAAVQGEASSDFWRFENYTAHPLSDDEERKSQLAKKIADCVDTMTSSIRPRSPDSNLLAALQRVGEQISNRPQPATVAVLSNGLNNTPPMDLRELIAKSVSPKEIVSQLASRGELPALDKAVVTFYGLGDVRPGIAPLPKPYRDWVTSLWMAICQAGRATKCTAMPGETASPTQPSAPPDGVFPALSTGPITDPSHPVIGDTLFQPGSAHLSKEADDMLRPVVEWMRRHARVIRVIGHTASWGSTTYRYQLSLDRAQAVADRLVTLTADRDLIKVAGMGSRQSLEPDQDAKTGRLIPEAAIRNRRVEIILGDER